jgi:hypothetical protein
MPSLIPILVAHHELPVPVRQSLATYARTGDPQVRARARRAAAAGLKAFDLSEAEIADLIDGSHQPFAGSGGSPSPRLASPSSARAQNT